LEKFGKKLMKIRKINTKKAALLFYNTKSNIILRLQYEERYTTNRWSAGRSETL